MVIQGILTSVRAGDGEDDAAWAQIEGLSIKIPPYMFDSFASVPLGSNVSIQCSAQWSRKGLRYLQAIAFSRDG